MKNKVDNLYKAAVKHIYAIGDVINEPMLAHEASEEDVAVAEIIAGEHSHVNYNAIPSVIYTHLEVAAIGMTEEQVKDTGIEYKISKFPFLANSRAKTSEETDDFVKIIVSKNDDMVLGAHIIDIDAGELIGEICLGMEFKVVSEDIARISHSHPGYSEAIKEASLQAFAKAIHIYVDYINCLKLMILGMLMFLIVAVLGVWTLINTIEKFFISH